MDCAAILKLSRERYLRCESYEDTGVVEGFGTSESRMEFNTRFVRGENLSIEWRRTGESEASRIWSDGTGTWSSYSFRHSLVQKVTNLTCELDATAGVSSGLTCVIPPLLFGVHSPHCRLQNATSFSQGPTESVEGVSCYTMQAAVTEPTDIRIEFWISQNDHSIRKITETVSRTPERLSTLNQIYERLTGAKRVQIPVTSRTRMSSPITTHR